MPTNGVTFAAFLAGLKGWAYPLFMVIALIFWAGFSFSKLSDLSDRVDRIESKLDQVILVLKK